MSAELNLCKQSVRSTLPTRVRPPGPTQAAIPAPTTRPVGSPRPYRPAPEGPRLTPGWVTPPPEKEEPWDDKSPPCDPRPSLPLTSVSNSNPRVRAEEGTLSAVPAGLDVLNEVNTSREDLRAPHHTNVDVRDLPSQAGTSGRTLDTSGPNQRKESAGTERQCLPVTLAPPVSPHEDGLRPVEVVGVAGPAVRAFTQAGRDPTGGPPSQPTPPDRPRKKGSRVAVGPEHPGGRRVE